jgi:hypothetical protein
MSELIDLTPNIEFHNICTKCGAINTLYPEWYGSRVLHRCEKCEQFSNGTTLAKWNKKHPEKPITQSEYERESKK